MSRSLLFMLIFSTFLLLGTHKSHAQSVVYYCPDMGAIGYAYSNDEDGHDIKALEQMARKDCETHGGKSCALLYETSKIGYGGVVKGKDVNGNPLVLAVGHQLSEKFLRSELKRMYLFRDGIEYNDVMIITWRAE
jgi:hypothetical protein